MKSEVAVPALSPPINSLISVEESEGGLNFSQLLQTLQRKWLLIAGIMALTTTAAAVKVLTDEPIYSSSFEVLAQAQSTETEVISNVPDTLTTQETETVNADLLKILTSPKVLEPVIDGLRTAYPQACPPKPTTNLSPDVAYDPCYRLLSRLISVSVSSKGSEIILVSFQDLDPQKVDVVIDLVAKAYLDYSLDSKQADIRRGLDFVEQKLPDLRRKVDALQGQMQALRLQYDLVDPGSRGSQLSSQVGSFSQEKLKLEIELKQLRNIYADLSQQLQQPKETNASSALGQNPRYQSVLNTLLALDTQIAEDQTFYLDSSPDMQVLKEQRQNLLNLLAQQGQQSQRELISQIHELEIRNQSLEQTIQGLNGEVKELSGISREFTDIERELGIATENLNRFLIKREALEIDAAQREIPWEIVTPPTEPQPQPVSLPQNLLLGSMLGLLLGAGVALLLDKSSGVIYGDEEIQRITRLPVLGRIPASSTGELDIPANLPHSMVYAGVSNQADHNGSGERESVNRQSFHKPYASDPFSESFRSLYTNIRLLNSERPIRSLAIGSTMANEGKSTVAIYLAEAAAAMGQKVLLVESDLRNPQIHQYLELSNTKGLTNLLSGEANPAIIQKYSPDSNLYVITAGSIPLDPTRLFSSRSMKRFAEQLTTKFDLVIYDTPPLLGQSDPYLIADNTDGLLLVTQPGRLKQTLLDRAMEQLRIADIKVLGVVTREI
jgi:succinoglycan biosynthesis transport protein ExoP